MNVKQIVFLSPCSCDVEMGCAPRALTWTDALAYVCCFNARIVNKNHRSYYTAKQVSCPVREAIAKQSVGTRDAIIPSKEASFSQQI